MHKSRFKLKDRLDNLNPFKRQEKNTSAPQTPAPSIVSSVSNLDFNGVPQAATSTLSAPVNPSDADIKPVEPEKIQTESNFTKSDSIGSAEGIGGTSVDVKKDDGTKPMTVFLDVSSWLSVLAKEATPFFPPAQSVFGALATILSRCQASRSNREAIESIIPRIERLRQLWSGSAEGDPQDQRFRRSLNETLERVRHELVKMESRSSAIQFALSDEYARKLASALQDINDALVEYQTALMNDMKRQLSDMRQLGAIFYFHQSVSLLTPLTPGVLKDLHAVENASFASEHHRLCFEGTRTSVLEAIESWASDLTTEKGVFWLSGSAGCGKSTLAQTFARLAFTQRRLGASFFCSRDAIDRSDLHKIFPTLAFQLAWRYPSFQSALLSRLKESPSLGQESLTNQCEKLVIEPLESTKLRTIIVVDALDECRDNSPESAFLTVLAQYISRIPNVKFFVTGRPEPRIRSGFRIASLSTTYFKLNDVDRSSVDRDIGIFLRTVLSQLVKQRSDMSLGTYAEWPPATSVDALVQKADGLFIFAETTFKVIALSSRRHPAYQLEYIVSALDDFKPEGRLRIDGLYLQILEGDAQPGFSSDDYADLRLAIAGIILVLNPLTVNALRALLRLKDVTTLIRAYHSVIHVPQTGSDPIRTFHKSFPDFLTDSTRCTNPGFYIHPSVYHGRLAVLCLQFIKEKTQKNICDLPRYAMNKDIVDISRRREERIGEALDYACRFWADHLCSITVTNEQFLLQEMLEPLSDFLKNGQLFWLEILSLAGALRSAVTSLSSVRQWVSGLPASKLSSDCTAWLDDGYRLVLDNYDAIQASATHIYHSALVLAPEQSLLRQQHHSELENEGEVLFCPRIHWDDTLRTIETELPVDCLITSPQGQYLAVAGHGDDGVNSRISLFGANTGECLATFVSTIRFVESLEFSHDETLLVLRSAILSPFPPRPTTQVWDVQTGDLLAQANMLCCLSPNDNQLIVELESEPEVINFHESYIGHVSLGAMDDLILGSARRLLDHPGPVSYESSVARQWASADIVVDIFANWRQDKFYALAWELTSGGILWSVEKMLNRRIVVHESLFAVVTHEGISIRSLMTGGAQRTISVKGLVPSLDLGRRVAWMERRTGHNWVLRVSEYEHLNESQDRNFEGMPSSSDIAFIPGTTNVVTCSFKVANWVHLHNIATFSPLHQHTGSNKLALPSSPASHTRVEPNLAFEGHWEDDYQDNLPVGIPRFQTSDIFPSSDRENVFLVIAIVLNDDPLIIEQPALQHIFFLREVPTQKLLAISDKIITSKCSPVLLTADIVILNCDEVLRFWRIAAIEEVYSAIKPDILPFHFIPVFAQLPCLFREVFPGPSVSPRPRRIEADHPWMMDNEGRPLIWLPQAWRPGVNRWHGRKLLHATDKTIVRVLAFSRELSVTSFSLEVHQRKALNLMKSITLSVSPPLIRYEGIYITLDTASNFFPGPEVTGPPVCWDVDGNPVWIGRVEYMGQLHPCEINPSLTPPLVLAYGGGVIRPKGMYQLLPYDEKRMEWIFDLKAHAYTKSLPFLAGYHEADGYVHPLYHGIALDISNTYLLPGKMGPYLGDNGGCNVASGDEEVHKSDGWLRLFWRQPNFHEQSFERISAPTGRYLKLHTDRPFPYQNITGPPVSSDADNNGLYVGRVLFNFVLQPCVVIVPASSINPSVYVPLDGRAQRFNGDFDLLPFASDRMEWVPHNFLESVVPSGRQPVGGGYDVNGSIHFNRLYHALASQDEHGVMVPGQAGEHIGGCSIIAGGLEISGLKNYKILCWIEEKGE